jgi:UDP-N-acetylglucosamine 2-epimerase (non-hydrolysing)
MNKVHLMFVFGTRPEAIKLAPVILKAEQRKDEFDISVITTGQHRQMLDDVLSSFGITPDRDLNIMAPGQSLFYVTSRIIADMETIIHEFGPDVIVVQGDTTTTLAGALSGFYAGKKIAHIEAGLRTGNNLIPFPEEINRKMTSVIANYHFAPNKAAKRNLRREGYEESRIYVTGNTVIDALIWTVSQIKGKPCPTPDLAPIFDRYPKFVLITGHRRESFGVPLRRIFVALRRLSEQNPGVGFVYPVHMNPNVEKPASEILANLPNFFLVPSLPYPTFCWLMDQCHIIITDSGGVQEEAPAIGKPLLVTRSVTERPEAVQKGMAKLVGDDEEAIVCYGQNLLDDRGFYDSMVKAYSPYGDGKASERILKVLAPKI